jgi:hypothetical protein
MRHRLVAVLFAVCFMLGTSGVLVPARAQFGSIFGGPPRPPGSVPGGRQQADPDTYPPPYSPPPPQQYPSAPPASGRGAAAPGAVQSQPLPPPPGGASPGANPTLSNLPPGQRAPVRPAAPDAPPQSDDQFIEPPTQKIANNSALFSGLDKITGRIINFDVAIGETVQFGALQVTPRACYTRPPTETANTDAFVEVDEVTLQGEVKRIFSGWMFAASPGLHGVEHAIYDVWLTDCKSPLQAAITPPTPDTPPPPARTTAPPQRTPQQAAQQRTPQAGQQPGQPQGQAGAQQRRPPPPPGLPPN